MDKGNCVHVCRDSVALISYRRLAPLTEVEIDSLMFTSLLPFAATILVNVEMDDSGVLEPATCDCSLSAMGFNQQVSNIYSYGKLTGQGMTLLGGDVLNILEKALPERFGGHPDRLSVGGTRGKTADRDRASCQPSGGGALRGRGEELLPVSGGRVHRGRHQPLDVATDGRGSGSPCGAVHEREPQGPAAPPAGYKREPKESPLDG